MGPVALDYKGNWSYGASNHDLWGDVPADYQGHYMYFDLRERYLAQHNSGASRAVSQYNSIREQEKLGLSRPDMIWNTQDYRTKYGNASGLMMWGEVMIMYFEMGVAEGALHLKVNQPKRFNPKFPGKTPYTKSNMRLGNQMHKNYKANEADLPGMCKECKEVPGVRPDFVDFNKGIIYELKPHNPNAIRRGHQQLQRYKEAYERKFGREFRIVLETY